MTMTQKDTVEYIFENSGINKYQKDELMHFTIICLARLFVVLSDHFEENMQQKLIDASIKSTKEISR